MSEDGSDDEIEQPVAESLENALPNLSDPDFDQFSRYLGVDVDALAQQSKQWDTPSTTSGSAPVSEQGSEGAESSPSNQMQTALLRIVQEAYVAPLPPNWGEFADAEGRIYFYNYVTEQSSWAHPTDRTYKELIQIVKKVKAARLSKVETMRIIDVHLQSVHSRAVLEALQGFSGPYVSDEGHEYYYNELSSVSTWESPIVEWEHNISTRYHVLYRCLIENQFREEEVADTEGGGTPVTTPATPEGGSLMSGLKLQLPLHLISRTSSEPTDLPAENANSKPGALAKFEPPTPSTSRSYHTARSQGSARTARARGGDSARLNSPKGKTASSKDLPPSPSHGQPAPPKPRDEDDEDEDEETFNFTFGTNGNGKEVSVP